MHPTLPSSGPSSAGGLRGPLMANVRARMRSFSAFVAFSITVLAHGTGYAHGEPTDVPLPGFSCATGTYGARLPTKLSALRAIGRIQDEQIVRVENWEGYRAIERIIRFDGLHVQVITFTNDPERYRLARIFIESPRWQVGFIRIGQPSAPLLEQLGASSPSRDGSWRFEGESDTLYVEAIAGKVFRVVYECYTG